MSPKPYPLFGITEQDKPEQIEMRIKLLIKLYISQNEQDIAEAIVVHINAVLASPKYIKDGETRCLYRRLAEHWRGIAWINDL